MAVYFLAEILHVNEPQKYELYVNSVRSIVENHGGEYVIRTNRVTLVSGKSNPDRILLIRFPDKKSLVDCFSSQEYNAIASLREQSTKSQAFIIEEDEGEPRY